MTKYFDTPSYQGPSASVELTKAQKKIEANLKAANQDLLKSIGYKIGLYPTIYLFVLVALTILLFRHLEYFISELYFHKVKPNDKKDRKQ